MVRYIVLWSLTPAALDEGAENVAEKLDASVKALVGKIPGLRHAEVRLNELRDTPHDLLFYTEFDQKEDIEPYRRHPLHVAHAQMASAYVTNREVMETEV